MTAHVLEHLSAFLDEELSAREREAVETHLRTCAACTGHLEMLRAVDAGMRALAVSAPPGYFEALPGRVRARLEKASRPRTFGFPVWTWAVAAALLLAVVTPLTLNRAPLPSAPEATYPPPVGAAPSTPAPSSAAEGFASPALEEAQEKVASRRLAKSKDDEMAKLLQQPAGNRADRPKPPAAVPGLPAKEELDASAELQDGYREQERPAEPATRRRAGPGGPSAQQQAPLQAQAVPPYAPPPAAAPAESAEAFESGAPRDEAKAPGEKAMRAGAVGRESSAVAASEERFFQKLTTPGPRTLAALREKREAWRAFCLEFATSPRADEARVRVIETGAEAWRLGADPADLARVREDAAAYLARRDAAQAGHVRAVLESLPAGTP